MNNNLTRRRHQVPAADATIDVIAEGAGPLMVLLPSSSRDSSDFGSVAARLATAGFRVLRPQPRGTANSTGRLDGLTLHDYAQDVAMVIQAEAAGPAIVIGHAFGQWVARTLAADSPHLVRGVVLAAAAAKKPPPELRAELAKCVDLSLPDEIRTAALQFAFFAPGHRPTPDWLTGWYPAASKSQRAASQATDQAEWWHGGVAPILDLQGANDPWRPRDTANDLRNELGADRVTVVVIPDCSHAMMPEQPEAVVAAVVDWERKLG